MIWDEMALVGRIARTHGLRGQMVVNLETDFPDERFRPGSELFVRRGGTIEALRVSSVRLHGDRPVIAVEGVRTIDEAEPLAGLELRIPVDRLQPLPPGTFYHHDLIGCRVETVEGTPVGVVRDVETTSGGSRLVVEGREGDVLVPIAAEICRVIEPGTKRIVIDPPEGLLDLNRARG
ncbi:MAG TPA: ribosome maturation factor RimM [Vicinamibacterales bacterium]